MVKIETAEEFARIKESNFGLIILVKHNQKAIIHKTDCEHIKKVDWIPNGEKEFHWFSSFNLAGKEFIDINSCKTCNP